jgi:acyl-CoA reductase-like NAD-dependent aldehyde dehydrogenase
MLAGMLQAGNAYADAWGGGDPAAAFGPQAVGIGRESRYANLDPYLESKTVWTQL